MMCNNPKLDHVNINAYIQNLVKFYQLILKILSGNEILTSIKGYNSCSNLPKMMCNNPKLDHVNINAYIQNFVKFYQFVVKILSGNENLTSIKGYNIFNINAHTIFFVKFYQLVL